MFYLEMKRKFIKRTSIKEKIIQPRNKNNSLFKNWRLLTKIGDLIIISILKIFRLFS